MTARIGRRLVARRRWMADRPGRGWTACGIAERVLGAVVCAVLTQRNPRAVPVVTVSIPATGRGVVIHGHAAAVLNLLDAPRRSPYRA